MEQEIYTPEAVTAKRLSEAMALLKKYRNGKRSLESRIVENEKWYRLTPPDADGEAPVSAWLFNSLANKHADVMDNYPTPRVLPREESDSETARLLSSVLPVVLEQNNFEQTYSDAWWYKLKTGTGVYGVFWDPEKENGLGDVDIRCLDLLNLFWEPGVNDLQKSPNVFHVELFDKTLLKEKYPFLKDESFESFDIAEYLYDDTVDTREKAPVIDWYYKVGSRVHFCKFTGDEVLFSSEDDPLYRERGYYDHGKYPFIFDVLFSQAGSPAGFGYVDLMKDAQKYIDSLGASILKNAALASKKRFFIRDDGAVNEEEFANWENDFIHVAGHGLGEDSIRELTTQPISDIYVQILQLKIEELKETSGNRDFSQGGTTSGVTAASAISALQEAGSKLSRDMIKSAYRAFSSINKLVIELLRQFYTEPRIFRITSENGEEAYLGFDNAGLLPQEQTAFGMSFGARKPDFDLKVVAQKASPFSQIAHNELAKELYSLGFFNPTLADQALAALKMMDFEQRDEIAAIIAENAARVQSAQVLSVPQTSSSDAADIRKKAASKSVS